MGKAVVATNVDGTPEMIEPEKNGLLIELDGLEKNLAVALIRLCNDSDLRKRLQQAAIASIYNTYNVETLARKNEAVYYSLVHRTKQAEYNPTLASAVLRETTR
jgi:glycosyltransferase involved in cell wall biosynthesis